MIRPPVSSTSTRDAVAPPARKNRRRSAPDTSTTSPASHFSTCFFSRPDQTAHSSESTR